MKRNREILQGGGFLRETALTADDLDIKIQLGYIFHLRAHAEEIKVKEFFSLFVFCFFFLFFFPVYVKVDF